MLLVFTIESKDDTNVVVEAGLSHVCDEDGRGMRQGEGKFFRSQRGGGVCLLLVVLNDSTLSRNIFKTVSSMQPVVRLVGGRSHANALRFKAILEAIDRARMHTCIIITHVYTCMSCTVYRTLTATTVLIDHRQRFGTPFSFNGPGFNVCHLFRHTFSPPPYSPSPSPLPPHHH